MDKTTKIILWVAVVIIVIIGGIWYFTNNQQQPVSNSGPIKIGYIGPLTGDSAVLGTEAVNAMQLAIGKVNADGGINGRTVQLITEDDQYDAAKSVTAYTKLVDADGVSTIIMSTYGGVMAVAEQAKKDNIVIIDALDCDQYIAKLGDNVFCIAKETKDLADVIADYATSKGYKNIGIIHSTVDNFMQSVSDEFTARVGSSVNVQSEGYPAQTNDFKTLLLKFKDKDAIVFLGYDEIGLAMKQAKDLGLNQQWLTIPTVATTPSIQTASAGAINGIIFSFYAPLSTNPVAAQFYKDFNVKYGRDPYVYVVSDQAYDTMQILLNKVLPGVDATTKAGQLNQKIDLLQAVKDYSGVTGNLTMKADGRISGILIRLYKLVNMTPVYIGS